MAEEYKIFNNEKLLHFEIQDHCVSGIPVLQRRYSFYAY